MVIDKIILEVADEYQPIGTIYQALMAVMAGTPIAVPSFAFVFSRVCELIQKDLLEHKEIHLSGGGYYALCRRHRRYAY